MKVRTTGASYASSY